jgi:hypothetical protein
MVVLESIVSSNGVTNEVHTGMAKVQIARRVGELAEDVHFLLALVVWRGKGITKDSFEHYYKLLPIFIIDLNNQFTTIINLHQLDSA